MADVCKRLPLADRLIVLALTFPAISISVPVVSEKLLAVTELTVRAALPEGVPPEIFAYVLVALPLTARELAVTISGVPPSPAIL